jgi:nicotinic acid phosphoribosyltransferase
VISWTSEDTTDALLASFGIGTFLTNDFVKEDGSGPSKALNMVIKLASINGVPCVKISDEISKVGFSYMLLN